MDSSNSNFIGIFEIYRRYCDIRVDIDSTKETQNSREALAQLRNLVELRGQASSLFNDLFKLMSYLDLTVDSCRFTCFYDFVFFMCRENGQKNITIEKAIEAWKFVLEGRFRLLHEWCTFVQKHQRHNISEDTWQQVLAFSRCVHEDLEGYDPKGAWPVVIDDFVDYMHRATISKSNTHSSCNCGDSEAQTCRSEANSFPGLKLFSGLKRKPEAEMSSCKRNRSMDMSDVKPLNDQNKFGGSCAIERSLSEGFAGLLSTTSNGGGSCSQFDHKARIINNCYQPH